MRSNLPMRVRSNVVRWLALSLLGGPFVACFAQAELRKCSLTDRACVDERYPLMCVPGANRESCVAWLREYEQSPDIGVRSSVAGMYLLMFSGEDPGLVERGAELIRGILQEDPDNVEGLLGHASLAQTDEERERALRRVVELDPTPMHLEFLARQITQDENRVAESAQLLERAYVIALERTSGYYVWRFARDAMYEYRSAGLPDRATQLRERFERDLHLDDELAETVHAESVDATRLKDILGKLCHETIIRMLDAELCLAAIDHVVAAADAARGNDKTRLAMAVSDAMFLAATTGDRLSVADAGWRSRFESTLRRYFGPEHAARMHEVQAMITIE